MGGYLSASSRCDASLDKGSRSYNIKRKYVQGRINTEVIGQKSLLRAIVKKALPYADSDQRFFYGVESPMMLSSHARLTSSRSPSTVRTSIAVPASALPTLSALSNASLVPLA